MNDGQIRLTNDAVPPQSRADGQRAPLAAITAADNQTLLNNRSGLSGANGASVSLESGYMRFDSAYSDAAGGGHGHGHHAWRHHGHHGHHSDHSDACAPSVQPIDIEVLQLEQELLVLFEQVNELIQTRAAECQASSCAPLDNSNQPDSSLPHDNLNQSNSSTPDSPVDTGAAGSDTAGGVPAGGQDAGTGSVPEVPAAGGSSAGTGSAVDVPTYNNLSAHDQIVQTDPELSKVLNDAQGRMSASGFAQFNEAVEQAWSSGNYFDNLSLMRAATGQLQSGGASESDKTAANDLTLNDLPHDDAVYTNLLKMNQALSDAAQNSSGFTSTGKFSTQGNQIIGPDGKVFIPAGSTLGQAQDGPTASVLNNGGNTVRLFIPHNPDDVPAFEKAIQDITSKGDVVIIAADVDPNGHQTGQTLSGSNLTAFEGMWGTLAAQYKDNPNVWLNTMNESGDFNSAKDPAWLAQQVGMIQAIRATGNNNIIVVDDSCWGQGATAGASSALAAYAPQLEQAAGGNLVGDVHVYEGGDQSQAATKISDAIDAIRSQGMPVMIGETGIWPTSNEPGMLASLSVGEQKGVGVLPLISGDTADGTFVPDFIADQNAFPDLRNDVLAYWQNVNQANATA